MPKHFTAIEELIDDQGFRDWCLGEQSGDAREFEAWYRNNPAMEPMVAEAKEFFAAIMPGSETVSASDTEHAKKRLMKAISEEETAEPLVISLQKKSRRLVYWLAAASVILVVFTGLWLFNSGKNKADFNTAYGQISESNLPDGSVVTLNANSSIILSKDWQKNNAREIWLKGEAFFKVSKKQDKQKFIVHMDEFDIVVTGTQFNAVNRKDKMAILLKEGSVTLKTRSGREIYLKPGEYFEYSAGKKEVEKKEAKELNLLAWKDKKLVFENSTLTDVAAAIKLYYGMTVVIENDDLKNRIINGILPNDNLEILMQSLEATQDFIIEKKGTEIVITKP